MEKFSPLPFILPFMEKIIETGQQINGHVIDGYISHAAFLAECIQLIDKSAVLTPVAPAAIVVNHLRTLSGKR